MSIYDIPTLKIGLFPNNRLSICILMLESHFSHDKIRQYIDEDKEPCNWPLPKIPGYSLSREVFWWGQNNYIVSFLNGSKKYPKQVCSDRDSGLCRYEVFHQCYLDIISLTQVDLLKKRPISFGQVTYGFPCNHILAFIYI